VPKVTDSGRESSYLKRKEFAWTLSFSTLRCWRFSRYRSPRTGRKPRAALAKGLKAFEGILPQLLTVLALIAAALALLDPATIGRFLGEGTGWIGVAIAGAIGSITLIPGFVAFPLAGELMRNGAGVPQVAAFVSTLMMVGVVTFPLEASIFGKRAALARNGLALAFLFPGGDLRLLGGIPMSARSILRRYAVPLAALAAPRGAFARSPVPRGEGRDLAARAG
jgi:hypothetical protein